MIQSFVSDIVLRDRLDCTVEVISLDSSIRILTDFGAVRVHVVALAVGILDYSEASLFNLLNCAIREDTLFFAI